MYLKHFKVRLIINFHKYLKSECSIRENYLNVSVSGLVHRGGDSAFATRPVSASHLVKCKSNELELCRFLARDKALHATLAWCETVINYMIVVVMVLYTTLL